MAMTDGRAYCHNSLPTGFRSRSRIMLLFEDMLVVRSCKELQEFVRSCKEFKELQGVQDISSMLYNATRFSLQSYD